MTVTRLILVRHGESAANVAGILAGRASCTGLSTRGRAQSERLGARLARNGDLRPGAVLTSTLPRAVETAHLATRGWWDGTVERDDDLCELHPGECEGMTFEQYRAAYGDPADDPERPLSPGGESVALFDARCRRAVDRLVDDHDGNTVLVFSHGGFISAACLYLLGIEGLHVPRSFRLDTANTALTEWWRTDADAPWVLARFNDVAHLETAGHPADG